MRRDRKGHRYIVPNQGPPEPARNTQAMPLLPEGKGAPTLVHFLAYKTGGFNWNAKSSVQQIIHLSRAETTRMLLSYNNVKQRTKARKKSESRKLIFKQAAPCCPVA